MRSWRAQHSAKKQAHPSILMSISQKGELRLTLASVWPRALVTGVPESPSHIQLLYCGVWPRLGGMCGLHIPGWVKVWPPAEFRSPWSWCCLWPCWLMCTWPGIPLGPLCSASPPALHSSAQPACWTAATGGFLRALGLRGSRHQGYGTTTQVSHSSLHPVATKDQGGSIITSVL